VWSYFTYPFNLTGQPAASVPCGVTDDGLPIGLQIVAPLCAESILIQALQLAEALLEQNIEPCEIYQSNRMGS
jgi:aspartyl-tRNA(Asn)/glutamyl-tRNA(Gln) amidotransferase subunit A